MNNRVDGLLERLRDLEHELESELDRALGETRERYQYSLRQGRIRFDREARRLQRSYRTGLWCYIRRARLAQLVTAPVIYSLIVPIALLDLMVCVYQAVCFPVYRIGKVRRSDFVLVDRHHLAYLNALEKLNCIYCGYANGVVGFAREVAARTEQHWCPIKHAHRGRDPHPRSTAFADYGDAESYHRRLNELRAALGKRDH